MAPRVVAIAEPMVNGAGQSQWSSEGALTRLQRGQTQPMVGDDELNAGRDT